MLKSHKLARKLRMLHANLPEDRGNISFREMTLHDVEAVHILETELFPADAWPLEMFLAEIQHPTRGYIVAFEDDLLVGYAGAMSIAETADVQTIAVRPSYEGQGIGRTMLDFLHKEALQRGAETILLEVRADNPRAQDLYTKNGYSHIHTRTGYYNDGVDAWIMQAPLTQQPTTESK